MRADPRDVPRASVLAARFGHLRRWLRAPRAVQIAIHLALTLVMGWLAVAMALPGGLLAVPAYHEFVKLATERQWTALFLLGAAVGAAGVVAPWRWVQIVSVCGLANAHLSVAYLFWLGVVHDGGVTVGTAVGTYSIIAMLGYFLAWVRIFE